MTQVIIPNSVQNIGNSAFYTCKNLANVTIPDGIKSIGDWTFSYCGNLTNIMIPNSIENIGYYAFGSCNKLNDIYYSGTLQQWNNIMLDTSNNGNDYFLGAIVHPNATGINPLQIGDLTLVGSGLSSGIADLIKVSLTYTDYDSTMLTVFYKDGAMIDMQTTLVKSGDEMKDISIPDNSGADSAKVFIWSSLDSMKPLCEAKEIKLTEEEL